MGLRFGNSDGFMPQMFFARDLLGGGSTTDPLMALRGTPPTSVVYREMGGHSYETY